jgi:hypothetical protein
VTNRSYFICHSAGDSINPATVFAFSTTCPISLVTENIVLAKTEIMKQILLVAGTLLIPAMATFAQDYNRDDVKEPGPAIKSQFTADFPDAKNVHFERVKDLNEVSFTQGKEKMDAYYDAQDQLVGTVKKESFADLPDNAQKEIQNKYPGYTIANVVKFDDNGSDEAELILYGISLDDADNYFVELKNDSKAIVVKVDLSGGVDYLTTMK